MHKKLITLGMMMTMTTAVSAVCAETRTGLAPIMDGVTQLAFYGDSLTDGSDFPEYIVNTLNKTHPDRHFTFINAGVCGNCARDLVDRLDRDILSWKPDLTFIYIGTNDKRNVPLIQFEAELLYLAKRLKAAESKVAFISLSGSTHPETAAELRPFSAKIQEVAKRVNAHFVDAWSFFEKEQASGKEMYYAPGDCHHSLEGFRGIARVILTSLGVPPDVEMDTRIRPPAYVLTDWEESGPITPLDKKTPVDPAQVTEWTEYDPAAWVDDCDWSFKPITQRGAWFSLQGNPRGRTAFARTTYDAPAAGLYELQLGGGTPLRVWVNGVHVYTLPKTNGYHPNAVRTSVLLKKGANEIIMTTGFYAFAGIKPLGADRAGE